MKRAPLGIALLLALAGCDGSRGDGGAAGELPAENAVPEAPAEPTAVPADSSTAEAIAAALDDTAWTAGPTEIASGAHRPVTINTVRAASNPEWDRAVWEFVGDSLPGYRIEFADAPIRQCGSGRELQVAGDAWLRVRIAPARGHDDVGNSTLSDEDRANLLLLPVVRELRQTCDFEGVAEWVLGLTAPRPYRVLELSDPSRLVVDVHY